MAKIFLVRHAKAGERRAWTGPDEERPLSKKGWRQSEKLAARLAKQAPTTLLSSSYVRCIQTLEPLGTRLGIDVVVAEELTEYSPIEPVLELLAKVDARSVLCSHGDIIPATIHALAKAGAQIGSPPDWRKASTWVLKRNKHGRIVRAQPVPPPLH